MFKFFSKPVVNSIKVYHNNSQLSNQLLNKLNNYNLSFSKCHEPISIQDFNYCLNNIIDVHPDNKDILMSLFGKKKYESLTIDDFKSVNHPLIIDYKHNLIAADEKSFNRLMTNYNLCGIQHFNNDSRSKKKWQEDFKQLSLIQPRVQEYADLF